MKRDPNVLTREEQKDRERNLAACEKTLGHRFADRGLLELALTHSSLRDEWTPSNERLEFLGDSVLGLAIAECLYTRHPDLAEGELTRIKSLVVSRENLTKVGKRLELKPHLRVGRGVKKKRAIPPSLIANLLEALVGAIYLDAGWDVARDKVVEWLEADVKRVASRKAASNYKASLQHATQRLFGANPHYVLLDTVGPDHKKEFLVAAAVLDRRFDAAKGQTKKQAEQRAARLALRALKKSPTAPAQRSTDSRDAEAS